jgi:hypothetical protein
MSFVDLQEQVKVQKYQMYIEPSLLTKLKINGVDINESIMFFATQVDLMINCPPNYGKDKNGLRKMNVDVRLLKGYYPKTKLLFKISVVERYDYFSDHKYTVKVSELVQRFKRQYYYKYTFNSSQVEKEISKRLENNLLGTKHEVSDLISPKDVPRTRCISPKGMKLFKLEEE